MTCCIILTLFSLTLSSKARLVAEINGVYAEALCSAKLLMVAI